MNGVAQPLPPQLIGIAAILLCCPAHASQIDASLGTRIQGDRVIVTAEAAGETAEEARENAEALARSQALSTRRTHVEREVIVRERESSSGWSSEMDSVARVQASGNLAGAKVVLSEAAGTEDGRPLVRVTLEVPRERLFPDWRIVQLLEDPPPPERAHAEPEWRREQLTTFMEQARHAGDFEAVELACRLGFRRDPCATYALEYGRLLEDLGYADRALRELGRCLPELPPEDRAPVEAELERLRRLTVDADVLLERLTRFVRGAYREELALAHGLDDGRATVRDEVRIRGTAPMHQAIHVVCIDGEQVSTPEPMRWPASHPYLSRPFQLGSTRARLRQTLSYYRIDESGLRVAQSESFVPGEVRLVYVSQAPGSPPPPLLEHPIDLRRCRGPHADPAELARLETFVGALGRWLNLPGNQAQELSWQQVR